ncbi:MAG TPA: OmpA family protein [Ramlibacter sp.]|nr:OmpA family protein [Ramlibacter sp.]
MATLAAPLAFGQENTGWYVGASAGRAAATIDDARIAAGLTAQGLGGIAIANDERSTGYKVFGGYQFTPYVGVEAGFLSLGHFGYRATTVPAGTLSGRMGVKGVNLDLVGTLPIMGGLSAIGRVGATSMRASDSFAATGAVTLPYASANPSQRTTGLKAGIGLAYAFTPSLSVRLEAERYRIKDAVGHRGDVDLLSLGLVYRFGASPAPRQQAVVAVPSTVQVAPPPAAPPPIAVAPPPPAPAPPAPKRVSLSADALFDFDKSDIKPAGREHLDKLASDLRGMRYDTIQVTGHTDRLGSHTYNLKLSERRAQAVAAYLSRAAGIPAGRISARGVDGDNPVTAPGSCKGNKPTRALIACLQPDRRVDVEVMGER